MQMQATTPWSHYSSIKDTSPLLFSFRQLISEMMADSLVTQFCKAIQSRLSFSSVQSKVLVDSAPSIVYWHFSSNIYTNKESSVGCLLLSLLSLPLSLLLLAGDLATLEKVASHL